VRDRHQNRTSLPEIMGPAEAVNAGTVNTVIFLRYISVQVRANETRVSDDAESLCGTVDGRVAEFEG